MWWGGGVGIESDRASVCECGSVYTCARAHTYPASGPRPCARTGQELRVRIVRGVPRSRTRWRTPGRRRRCGTAGMRLDAASYGVRWVLLSPAPGAGVARPTDSAAPGLRFAALARPPDPDFQFGQWLVTAWASGPARVGGRCENYHLAECSAIRSVVFLRLQRTAVATAVLYRASPRDAREKNIDNSNG